MELNASYLHCQWILGSQSMVHRAAKCVNENEELLNESTVYAGPTEHLTFLAQQG